VDADVVVIGAGAAGLAAARSLAARSLRVIIVEARDRVGGRVWWQPSPQRSVATELGAEFIHGEAPETMALLRAVETATVDTDGESWMLRDGRLQRTDNDFIESAGIFVKTLDLPADESVDRFLRRFEDDEKMRDTAQAARAFVEGFEAADPAIASAQAIAKEWQSGVDFASARPLGGYGPMFEYLRNECVAGGVRSLLSTVVRQISWRRGSVDVTAQSRDAAVSIHARAAVVTLPVGVLRHAGDETAVAFDPEMPASKRDALRYIEMGQVVKVALWFRTAFWERLSEGRYRDAGFFRSAGQPFAVYWTQFPVRSGLIVAWAGGPKAIALGDRAPDDLIQTALDGFGALFDESKLARAEFQEGVVHEWDRDPFARGAYSYVAVEGGDAREVLGAPLEDTLFFAGEATSTDGQGGTVNGALETGERAAREAAAALGTERER
jgi:monoamine oxidase